MLVYLWFSTNSNIDILASGLGFFGWIGTRSSWVFGWIVVIEGIVYRGNTDGFVMLEGFIFYYEGIFWKIYEWMYLDDLIIAFFLGVAIDLLY